MANVIIDSCTGFPGDSNVYFFKDADGREISKSLVSTGVKNKFNRTGYSPDTETKNHLTLTWQSDGTIIFNGTCTAKSYFTISSGFTGADFTPGDILSGIPSAYGSVLSMYIQISSGSTKYAYDTGSGGTIPTSLSPSSSYTIGITADTGAYDNVIVKPMICSKPLFTLDSSYAQYAPTNRELYEMILAIQAQL